MPILRASCSSARASSFKSTFLPEAGWLTLESGAFAEAPLSFFLQAGRSDFMVDFRGNSL
jgi:hypothetical protein